MLELHILVWRTFSIYPFVRIQNTNIKNITNKLDIAAELKTKLCKKYSITRQTLNNQISGRTPITVAILNDILIATDKLNGEMIKEIISSSRFTSGVGGVSPSIKIPIKLDKNLAYFIGALRDGVLCTRGGDKGEYVIELYQKNLKWLKTTIKPIIKTLFDITANINKKEMRIRIYSKPLYIFIKELFEYRDTRKEGWITPSLILQSDKDIQKAYIQAFFDTEGWLTKNFRCLGIAQSWHKENLCPPLNDIKEFLQKNNIKSRVKMLSNDNPNWKPRYVLSITKKSDICNFITEIGSRHPEKSEMFEAFLRGFVNPIMVS